MKSRVRRAIAGENYRDQVFTHGFTQWSGAVEDESSAFRFYDDAIHMYGGKQSCAIVFRLPSNIINWSIIRPTEMEGRNALSEWRSMITSWQLNEDGSVEIPASEVMLLRESFDLFDTDKSGALDMQEVKVAIEQCGLAVSDEDLQGIIAEIDKDGSGEFEFVEFVELVKTLVLRIREAEDAEETAVKLRSEIDGIKLELKARQEELKLAEAKVFELRKAGAQGAGER
uniref:EF-hand domain-containing protein n=2 Tax=Guillardia theta TaxID=55529 RepID=A0A7S4U7C7_GUITH|mmetsp:Transcript_48000/g.150638  ORF Transcript_48000/g.150638 Transcript_48000/m.150638 type:complete len:228 (+) Transcript_48000:519-1202(+)